MDRTSGCTSTVALFQRSCQPSRSSRTAGHSAGIDRLLTLACGRTFTVDEKIRAEDWPECAAGALVGRGAPQAWVGAEAASLRLRGLRLCAGRDVRAAARAGIAAGLAAAWAAMGWAVRAAARRECGLYICQRSGAARGADAGDR